MRCAACLWKALRRPRARSCVLCGAKTKRPGLPVSSTCVLAGLQAWAGPEGSWVRSARAGGAGMPPMFASFVLPFAASVHYSIGIRLTT